VTDRLVTDVIQPLPETIQELHHRALQRAGTVAAFDPTTSPLHGKALFIVGAPRSGTTWLHQLLATHPDVATGGEAHLFCEGVGALFDNHDDDDPNMGLSTWVTRPELVAFVRQLADGVFMTMRDALRPGATRILDKTPNHVPYAARLAEVYPDATFVHIIRDARDSVSSQHDLWSSWDSQIGAWDAAAAAWRVAVEDARRHLGGLHYHEVRYEDLVREPEARFAEILEAAGLEHDDAFVADAVAFCRAPINVRASDARVAVRKWADMDPIAERAVVRAAGDLMVSLGDLSPAERDRILARRTWRDTVGSARHAASSAIAGVRRRQASNAQRRAIERRAGLRKTASSIAEAATQGDAAGLATLLAADVVVEEGGAIHRGTGDASARLLELRDGRVISVTADDRAGAINLVGADGSRHVWQVFVDGDRVARLVLQH
jgi:LPS sulfotransferase NodH